MIKLKNSGKMILQSCFATIFVFLCVGVAYPCKCVKNSLKTNYKNADIVIIAKVMETTDLGNNTIKIDVNVINAWKEKVSQKFSILIEKDSCEYQMTKGESYLLYLEKLDTGSFTTDLCRGNFVESKSLTAKKWLKRYGKKAHIQS